MLRERSFQATSVQISYGEGADNGSPVVLLHGITGHRQYWDPVVPWFAARHHVFALDLRGHGRSGRVRHGYRYLDYAQDVVEFLDQVIEAPVILVGHSLGALVALNVSVRLPDQVRAAVLEDPPLYAHERPLARTRERFRMVHRVVSEGRDAGEIAALLQRLASRDPADARVRAEVLAGVDPGTLDQVMDGSVRDAWETDPQLAQVACPVLLLQADPALGGALTAAAAQQATSLLRGGTWRQFPGVGHSLHRDAPESFTAALDAFLHDTGSPDVP